MAAENIIPITVDIKILNYIVEKKVTANDDITFVIDITDNGQPINLASVTTVALANKRLDGRTVITPGDKTGIGTNQVTFHLGRSETAVKGRVAATVQLYDANGRVSTIAFGYNVTNDPTGASFIPLEGEKTLIEVVLGEGPLRIQEAIAATNAANQSVVDGAAKIIEIDNKVAEVDTFLIETGESFVGEQDVRSDVFNQSQFDREQNYDSFELAKETEFQTFKTAKNGEVQVILDETRFISDYNQGVAYKKNNIVSFNGSSYIARQNTIGNPPPTLPQTTNAFWGLAGRKGADGTGTVVRHRDEFIATAGQTVFNLSNTYDQFQNRIDAEVGGVPQFSPENFIESSSTTATLTEGATIGTKVIFTYFSEALPLANDIETTVNSHTTNLNTNNNLLSTHTALLADKASKTELSNVLNGSPKGIYATLALLQAAFPTGTTGVYIVQADGHIYSWSGSAWVDRGLYQAAGVADSSITPIKTSFITLTDDPSYVAANSLTGAVWSAIGNVRNAEGTTNAFASWVCTGLIPLEPNTTYQLKGKYGSWNYYIYDQNGQNGIQTSLGITSGGTTIYQINVGSDRRFIAFNASQATGEGFNLPSELYRITQIESEKRISIPKFGLTLGSVSEQYLDSAFQAKINSKSLTGKKVVNFGDSIFGNIRDVTSVSNYIALKSGATVHNVGFGGCRMAFHPTNGYKAFSMYKLANAITTGIWTEQDTGLTYAVPSYFAEALAELKAINFNTVDYITIAYGSNDFTGTVPMDDMNDQYATYFFKGALRYSIKTILEKFPHIKIVLLTPAFRFWSASGVITETTDTKQVTSADDGLTRKLSDFCDAVISIGKDNKLPVLDNLNELGINKFNCAYYIPIADGAHHNDLGRKLIGEKTAKFLSVH